MAETTDSTMPQLSTPDYSQRVAEPGVSLSGDTSAMARPTFVDQSQVGGQTREQTGMAPQTDAQRRASIFHSLVEVMAGGPQYQYNINEKGQMEKVPTQRRTSQLANSIVAGALTGLFAGAGETGAGAKGRAMQKGFAAAQQLKTQQDAQAKQEATADFARKRAVLESNLKLSTMQADLHAKNLNNMSKDAAFFDENTNNYSDTLEYAKDNNLLDPRFAIPQTADWYAKNGLDKNVILIPAGKTTTYGKYGPEGYEQTFVGVKTADANGNPVRVPYSDSVRYWGISGADKMPENGTAKLSFLANMEHTAAVLTSEQRSLNMYADQLSPAVKSQFIKNFQSSFGSQYIDPKTGHIDLKALHSDPKFTQDVEKGLLAQMKVFHSSGPGGMVDLTHPWEEVDRMAADPQASKYSGFISTLYGGKDVFDRQKEEIAGRAEYAKEAGKKKAALEEAKGKELLPSTLAKTAKDQAEAKKALADAMDKQTFSQLGIIDANAPEFDPTALSKGINPNTGNRLTNGMDLEVINKLPAEDRAVISNIVTGRQPLTPQYTRTKEGQKFGKMLTLVAPGFDVTQAKNWSDMNERWAKGKVADQLTHLSAALQHAGMVYDNIGPITTMAGVGAVFSELGYGPANAIKAQMPLLRSEIHGAYETGAITNQERDEMLGQLPSTGWVPGFSALKVRERLESTVDALGKKVNALREEWNRNTPPSYEVAPMKQLVDPAASAAYEKITKKPMERIAMGMTPAVPAGRQIPGVPGAATRTPTGKVTEVPRATTPGMRPTDEQVRAAIAIAGAAGAEKYLRDRGYGE